MNFSTLFVVFACLFLFACRSDDDEVIPAPEYVDPFTGYLNEECDAYVTHRIGNDSYGKFHRFGEWWVIEGINELIVRRNLAGPDNDRFQQFQFGVNAFLEEDDQLLVCTSRGMFSVTADGFIHQLDDRNCKDLQKIDGQLLSLTNHTANSGWNPSLNGIYAFSLSDTSYQRLDAPIAELDDPWFFEFVQHEGHYFVKANYEIEVGVLEYDADWNFLRLHQPSTDPALGQDFQLFASSAQLFAWKDRLFLFARNGSTHFLYEKVGNQFKTLRSWQLGNMRVGLDNVDWRLHTTLRERFIPRADTLYCAGDGGLVKFYESDADTLAYDLLVDPNLPTNIWADLHFDDREQIIVALVNHEFLVERNCAE